MRERMSEIAGGLGPPVGVGLVLGLIGPFGTFDLLSAPTRLAYWTAVVSLNWVLADAVIRRIDVLAADRLPAPRLSVPLAGAFAAAVPATGLVALANGLSGMGWPENAAALFGQVLLLLAAIAVPVHHWEHLRERADTPLQPGPRSAGDASAEAERPEGRAGLELFAERLPRALPGRLLCLEMQDHYIVVHATGGSQMILCRMDDAARELAGIGRRVHRSWWVAADAVDRVERDGQRTMLRLIDERRVPVGRSFRPDLKGAGWI